MILNKTNGYNALMRFFRPAYLNFASPGQSVTKEKFFGLFERVGLSDNDFDRTKFLPGSTVQQNYIGCLFNRRGWPFSS